MTISEIIDLLESALQRQIAEELLFDPGNTPYVNITIIYTENGVVKERSLGTFLSVKRIREPIIKPVPSTHKMEECVGLSKVLTASYLESTDLKTDEQPPLLTDYGFCDSVLITPDIRVIISIVASPSDTIFCYTYVKNRVEISFQITQSP